MESMKTLVILLAIVCCVSRAPAQDSISPDKHVTYKKIAGKELKLHVFYPEGYKTTGSRPAIVFFFGGGWMGGTPKQFYQHSRDFAAKGFITMSAEYRAKGDGGASPFDCVKDGKSAVRWIRQHAKEMGIDPDRIIAAGGSAGGHVAACTGTIQGHEEEGEDLDISSLPNAMILYNPVLDTTDKGYGAKRFAPEQQTDLSPCHHVRKGIVPTLVFHGTADSTVPFENAKRFTRLMKEAGNNCVLVPFEKKNHGFFNGSHFRSKNGDDDYNVTMLRSLEFLEKLKLTPNK